MRIRQSVSDDFLDSRLRGNDERKKHGIDRIEFSIMLTLISKAITLKGGN